MDSPVPAAQHPQSLSPTHLPLTPSWFQHKKEVIWITWRAGVHSNKIQFDTGPKGMLHISEKKKKEKHAILAEMDNTLKDNT